MTATTQQNILSQRVLHLAESETLKMARMARELRALGHDVISLSLGEPDFQTPDHIIDAAYQAMKDGYTKYTPVAGLPELTKAVSEKFKRDNNLDYRPEQIVVSNGAKQSVYNLCQALLDPGDEVVIFAPYWVSYWEIVKLSGGVPVPVYAGVERDFKPSPAQVAAAITERTKFIIFSSPCNPTGTVFTREELQAYADVIAPFGHVFIVSDEIYEYINFTHEHVSIGSFSNVKDRTITVNGFAKGFAMTGWRLGYMGAPKFIADACTKIQGQVTSGASAFGQKAGAIALMSDLGPTEAMREAFRERRDIVLSMLEEIPGIKANHPDGAFYVFPDVTSFFGKTDGHTTIRNADDFCDYIMSNAYVGLVSGSAFGDPNCFRLSYAASEEQLREALRRMKDVLGRLR
ncbi:MAG: pyridoxal phosphate-dependent aminotransferase [Haliscomenobacteraceae bacterium CHB4]|nr:Aspartate aminotransferase [Saprospiraceae bacterium]MCE7926438.1 pyridoxal phosphate-dependent aminotransferase [Haliscomenobacteraceae bacterium CHB4]